MRREGAHLSTHHSLAFCSGLSRFLFFARCYWDEFRFRQYILKSVQRRHAEPLSRLMHFYKLRRYTKAYVLQELAGASSKPVEEVENERS